MVPENSNSLTHFTRNDGEYILTTVQAGAPMPHKMEPYLDSNLFYRIRNECDMARSREAFMNVINNYNSHDQIRGALQGVWEENSIGEVVASHVEALFGMFLGGFGGVKQSRVKIIAWHVPTLVSARNGGYTLPASATYVSDSNAPVVVTAIVTSNTGNLTEVPVVQGQPIPSYNTPQHIP